MQVGSANRTPFARNEVRCPKTEEKLQFSAGQCGRVVENELRCPKTGKKLRFSGGPRGRVVENELRCSKTEVKWGFQHVSATISHEMRFDVQKL